METELKRVTTTKKSNKVVKTLLIIAGILGVLLIIIALYFYKIKPTTQKETIGEKKCVCYFIDPAVTAECGDPRKGFGFTQSTVKSNEACPACSTSSIDIEKLYTTTKQELFVSCQLQNVLDYRCRLMTVTNSDGKIVTGQISPDEEITVEAVFDGKYTNPQFNLNNSPEEPDTISEDGLTIKKSFTNLTGSSIDIVATANDGTGELINSPLCKRVLNIAQQAKAKVTGLQLTKRVEGETNKVSKAVLRVSNLKESDSLSINYSFDDETFPQLSMNKGLTFDDKKGELVMIEKDLYNAENFTNGVTFSQLDNYIGTLNVIAELKDGETSLGKAETELTFKEITGDEEDIPEPEPPAEEIEESNFSIVGSANVSCLERVAPNNSVGFTIDITNNAGSTQTIKSIKNKLPLGFIYTASSTRINNIMVTDIDYLKNTFIGQTSELVWATTNGWAIGSGKTLSLVFYAQAGENALTGPNQNEVVIEPAQVPIDPNSLRAEIVVNVAQLCGEPVQPPEKVPDTGIFDTMLSRVIAGIIILIVGWYIYTKPFGQIVAKRFINSGVYKGAEMTSWKVFKPKKYFEEITIKKLGKKKK